MLIENRSVFDANRIVFLAMSNRPIGTSSLYFIAAATAAAATMTVLYVTAFASSRNQDRRRRSESSTKYHRFRVPKEILRGDCKCRDEVILAVRLALEGEFSLCFVIHAA